MSLRVLNNSVAENNGAVIIFLDLIGSLEIDVTVTVQTGSTGSGTCMSTSI